MSNQDIIDLMNENTRLCAQVECLKGALEFYANPKRYEGPNTHQIADDPHQPKELVYRYDVTRDQGRIAQQTLAKLGLINKGD